MTKQKKLLFVFDLDDTLYLRTLENEYEYSNSNMYHLSDKYRAEYENKIKNILSKLKEKGHKIAMASHNTYPYRHLKRMDIIHLFDFIIGEYPRSKVCMIKEIVSKTNSHIDDVLFFDDNERVVNEVRKYNIKTYFVETDFGIDLTFFDRYID